MGRIGEKGGTSLHGGQMATFAFDAQLLLDAALRSHQAHERLGLMSVELIRDEDPCGLRVGLDALGDMGGEVGFSARGSKAGCHDLPGSHFQIGDQTLGAMPLVLKLLALDVTWLEGQAGMQTLQSLDASHFIGTQHMRALLSKGRGGLIDLTDRADLLA